MTKSNLQFKIEPQKHSLNYRWVKLYEQGYDTMEHGFWLKDIDEFLQAVPHTDLVDRRAFRGDLTLFSGQLFLTIDGDDRSCYFISKGGNQAITDFLDKYQHLFEVATARKMDVTYYYMDRGKIDYQNVKLDLDKLTHTYPELYPDIDISVLDREFQRSNDSILILYGAPGVGKTTFIKYMLDGGSYSNALYVKDVNVMKSGDFWCKLTGARFGVMILDDLDFALSPRKANEDSTLVTNLLSYSDGIFNQNAKVVITTNQPVHQIDTALLRPGRCFDFLTLQPLTQEQAQAFWIESLSRPMDQYFEYIDHRQEHVTQAEIMNAHRRLSENIKKGYMRNGNILPLEQRLEEAGVNTQSDRISFT